jgi:hypothetical protein
MPWIADLALDIRFDDRKQNLICVDDQAATVAALHGPPPHSDDPHQLELRVTG